MLTSTGCSYGGFRFSSRRLHDGSYQSFSKHPGHQDLKVWNSMNQANPASGTFSANPCLSQEDIPTHRASGRKWYDQQGCIFMIQGMGQGQVSPPVLLLLWEACQPLGILGVPCVNCSLHDTLTEGTQQTTFSRQQSSVPLATSHQGQRHPTAGELGT